MKRGEEFPDERPIAGLGGGQGEFVSMSQSNLGDPESLKEAKLPRRDFVILPLIGLLTVAVCLLAAEAVAGYFFSASRDDSCRTRDPMIVFRFRNNCTANAKPAEGPWISYHFNDCGYRTKESCGPKPPGTTRIVLLGASVAEGYYVEYDDTFAARAAKQLTRELSRPVEVQNMGREQCYPTCVFHRIDEALALKPDILLLAVTPSDIERINPSEMAARYQPMLRLRSSEPGGKQSFYSQVQDLLGQSHAAIAAQHFMFQNTQTYLRLYLLGREHSDYLRTPLSPAWEKRMDAYEIMLDEIAGKARDANVPVVLIETPSLAQAALLSANKMPPGVSPHSFNERLNQISSRHGIQFIDVLESFKGGPEASKLFYIVDSHMNGAGNALVSTALVDQLMKEQHEALLGRNEAQQPAALKSGR